MLFSKPSLAGRLVPAGRLRGAFARSSRRRGVGDAHARRRPHAARRRPHDPETGHEQPPDASRDVPRDAEPAPGGKARGRAPEQRRRGQRRVRRGARVLQPLRRRRRALSLRGGVLLPELAPPRVPERGLAREAAEEQERVADLGHGVERAGGRSLVRSRDAFQPSPLPELAVHRVRVVVVHVLLHQPPVVAAAAEHQHLVSHAGHGMARAGTGGLASQVQTRPARLSRALFGARVSRRRRVSVRLRRSAPVGSRRRGRRVTAAIQDVHERVRVARDRVRVRVAQSPQVAAQLAVGRLPAEEQNAAVHDVARVPRPGARRHRDGHRAPLAGGDVQDVQVVQPPVPVEAPEQQDVVPVRDARGHPEVPRRHPDALRARESVRQRAPPPRRGVQHPHVAVLLSARAPAQHVQVRAHRDRAVERARAGAARRGGRRAEPTRALDVGQRARIQHDGVRAKVFALRPAEHHDVPPHQRRGVAASRRGGGLVVRGRRRARAPAHRGVSRRVERTRGASRHI